MTPDSEISQSIWIDRVQRWGLGSVAVVLIDVLRPLGFFASQALHLSAPILTTFVDPARLENLSGLLEDPDRLQQLSEQIDSAREVKP